MGAALSFGLTGPDTIIVALAGFIVRGGFVLLVLPSVVLPSVIGLAGVIGVDAFGIDGRPQEWFVRVVIVGAIAVVAWLAMASFLGSLIDLWLVDASLDPGDEPLRSRRSLPRFELLTSMAAIRGVCIVPLAGALAWAGNRIYSSAYTELTVPTDLATPLPLRIAEGAVDAVIVIVVVWVATETIAAIAVRRLVLTDSSAIRALAGAIGQVVRRPLTTVATVLVAVIATVATTGLALAATATAFDWCRIAARNQDPIAITLSFGALNTTRDFRPVVFVLAALALAIAWVTAAALSGIASAWRSAIWTGEVASAVHARETDTPRYRLGLSGEAGERSGD
jgi:hypothetical protein